MGHVYEGFWDASAGVDERDVRVEGEDGMFRCKLVKGEGWSLTRTSLLGALAGVGLDFRLFMPAGNTEGFPALFLGDSHNAWDCEEQSRP